MRNSVAWVSGFLVLTGWVVGIELDASATVSRQPQILDASQIQLLRRATNISEIVNRPTELIKYQVPTQVAVEKDSHLWNGLGEIPGKFREPWHFTNFNFDPLFHTPYWNENLGFTQTYDPANGLVPWAYNMGTYSGAGGSGPSYAGLGYSGQATHISLSAGPDLETGALLFGGPPPSRSSRAL